MRVKLIGIFICMLLIGTVLPVTGTVINIDIKPASLIFGNNLYVGGTGEGNYTKIQDAIDNTSDGDTVFVYDDLSPYYEHIVLDKSIKLFGENKDTTIIDGNGIGVVVNISANDVIVSDFTIQNSGSKFGNSGIEIHNYFFNISILNNNIFYNNWGIYIYRSWDDLVEGNNIKYNEWGIWVFLSTVTISNNIIGEKHGIYIHGDGTEVYNNNIFGNLSDIYGCEGIEIDGDNNIISGNTITKSDEAIDLGESNNNKIIGNNISFNQGFISLIESNKNLISQNNFIGNEDEGRGHIFINSFDNIWEKNYWNRKRFLPYIIFGTIWIEILGGIEIRWFNIDWNPAKKPYDIGI